MTAPFRLCGLLVLATVCATSVITAALAQQRPAPQRRDGPEITKKNATGDAAEVLAFEEALDAAIAKGDRAFVDQALAKDFVYVPDARWTTGGVPQVTDDRAAYLTRVTDREDLIRDSDQVKVEMHPGIAITWGRHVSIPRRQDASAHSGRLMSTWFYRVYAKRAGQWQILSHRVTLGPTAAPAGADPLTFDGTVAYGIGPVWFVKHPAPAAAPRSADERELLQLDQKVGTAVVKGDVNYLKSVTTSSFSMQHGDVWARGGRGSPADTQESMLHRAETGAYDVIDFDHMQVEMHDDIALTYGHYVARLTQRPQGPWFTVWFVRVFQKQAGRWIYLSHRTVHGPMHGLSREAIYDK